LWFIEGSGDERRLAEILHGSRDIERSTIWTGNAQAAYWTPKAKYDGDLGRVYGVQWRDWRGVDQLSNLIEGIKKDPNGRRHILTAWNVDELDQMALPPCHVLAQFYVSNGKLSCHMYQRSVDVFLGLPFNIASYALLTHMIAQVCDLKVGELVISTGDTHIYSNHIEQVKEQLSREEYPLPILFLDPKIKNIDKFLMDDILLFDYQSHGTIKADMAV
jgi:thymidylate synthase